MVRTSIRFLFARVTAGFLAFVLIASCAAALPQGQGSPTQDASPALTNADILKMIAGGLNEEVIVGVIQGRDTQFDVSVDALIALKKDNVGDKTIQAMIAAEARKRAPAPCAQPQASGPAPAPEVNPMQEFARQMQAMAFSQIPPQALAFMPMQMRAQMMPLMGNSGAGGPKPAPGETPEAFSAAVSKGQVPKVILTIDGKALPLSPSQTQVAQTKTKGGSGHPSMVGNLLKTLAMTSMNYMAFAGPGSMMAAPAMNLANGFMMGMQSTPKMPTTTYVWALPGRNSTFNMTTPSPSFEIEFANLVGVNPADYEPVLVHLVQSKDNWRLVGATRSRMDWNGGEKRTAITEERVEIQTTKLGRGHVRIEPIAPLPPGEYAVVVHPTKAQEVQSNSNFGHGAAETIFYAAWDFSIPKPVKNKKGH